MQFPANQTTGLKATRDRCKRTLDDQLIPMINVVFLLLIFFMIAGRIEGSDNTSIELPESNLAETLTAAHEPFFMTSDGELFWRGQSTPIEHVAGILKEHFDSAMSVPIRADKTTAAKKISPFISAAHSAGFRNVRFITLESAGIQ